MRIVLSNDDGIESNGLRALVKELNKRNELLVIAPDGNRSAFAHSISIWKPITFNKIEYEGVNAYVSNGTPVDCIKFANIHLKEFNPDIVVAGINKGHNLGDDTNYSATLAIASEGAFFNKVSFAFSAFSLGESNFEKMAKIAVKIIDKLYPISQKGTVWNINFPQCENYKGIKITSIGKQVYTDRYEELGNNTYRLVGELVDHDKNTCDSDVECVKNGFISVTPVLYNKTNYEKFKEVYNLCIEL